MSLPPDQWMTVPVSDSSDYLDGAPPSYADDLNEAWSDAARQAAAEARRAKAGSKPIKSDLGVTPFRPEDSATGFYDSDKAKAFEADAKSFAEGEGMRFDGLDKVGGVWDGGEEPSYALHVSDGEDAAGRVMDKLGSKYKQDGVLRFTAHPKGQSVRYVSEDPMSREEAIQRVHDAGLPGATHLPSGRLEVIDINGENAEASKKAFDGLAHGFSYRRGHAELRLAGEHYER